MVCLTREVIQSFPSSDAEACRMFVDFGGKCLEALARLLHREVFVMLKPVHGRVCASHLPHRHQGRESSTTEDAGLIKYGHR